MEKKVLFADKARQSLLAGVNTLADAVVSTLGPSGRNVIIELTEGNPQVTKDGVTVAKALELSDPIENVGCQTVKQASIETGKLAGDGTTTSTLLARELYKRGLEVLEQANVTEVKRGIDLAVKEAVKILKTEYSKDVTEEHQIEQVATISGNNDPEVGALIASAMEKAGREGVITIEESRTGETYLEVVEGMQFDRGYKSPYFVTDNNSMTTALDKPLILITDKKLNNVKELLPLLESVSSSSRSLLIIADDIEGEVLSTLVVNKVRGILNVVAVKAPDFGDRRKAVLEDIAVITGGTVVSAEKGMKFEKFDENWLGSARKVTVSRDDTTIVDGKGTEEAILARVEEIKSLIDKAVSPFEKETLQSRLGRLIGGVAIIHVGGFTEVEMKEKKDRVDDALHATKAALQEGILPGGGTALLVVSKMLPKSVKDGLIKITHPDQKIGVNIVIEALRQPFIQIQKNAGDIDINIEAKIDRILNRKGSTNWTGYNPRTEQFVDMLEEGIVDPTKVTRLALENAASVAGTLLTSECVIYNVKPKATQQPVNFDLE